MNVHGVSRVNSWMQSLVETCRRYGIGLEDSEGVLFEDSIMGDFLSPESGEFY
jgi:hypothetical protein